MMPLDTDRVRRHGLKADDRQQEGRKRANRKEVR